MNNKCRNCAEKCPQAEIAHQAALGRMYATNELTALLKKVDNGELVEVVRCKDCKWYQIRKWSEEKPQYDCRKTQGLLDVSPDAFCSYGKRRTDDQ